MGSRLATRIEVAPELEEALFPAMTLVPLVEHAVRYGLEPVPLGGRLEIHAERKADRLEVTVRQDEVYGGPGETSTLPRCARTSFRTTMGSSLAWASRSRSEAAL